MEEEPDYRGGSYASMEICDDGDWVAVEYAERLKTSLADAIRRPMGVIPDSAAGLLSHEELDEAEKRRSL